MRTSSEWKAREFPFPSMYGVIGWENKSLHIKEGKTADVWIFNMQILLVPICLKLQNLSIYKF